MLRNRCKNLDISIHSARVGGDIGSLGGILVSNNFNPLRPCGRRPPRQIPVSQTKVISIHSARVGGDMKKDRAALVAMNFNPLRPCGRRLGYRKDDEYCGLYFNPLRPCGRRLLSMILFFRGSDFNPLRPCGRRLFILAPGWGAGKFQSTPPVWAETKSSCFPASSITISIHSARVGGDQIGIRRDDRAALISIHSARVGGD